MLKAPQALTRSTKSTATWTGHRPAASDHESAPECETPEKGGWRKGRAGLATTKLNRSSSLPPTSRKTKYKHPALLVPWGSSSGTSPRRCRAQPGEHLRQSSSCLEHHLPPWLLTASPAEKATRSSPPSFSAKIKRRLRFKPPLFLFCTDTQ